MSSSKSGEKFLAVIMAREDRGLLEPCVRHLLQKGFSAIHVVCVESFAEERDMLCVRFASVPQVSISSFNPNGKVKAALVLNGPLFAPILDTHSPDWLAILDVDEMFSTNFDKIIAVPEFSIADEVVLNRYNYAVRRGEDVAALLCLLSGTAGLPVIHGRRDGLQELSSEGGPRWLFHSIGPRTIFRPEKFSHLAPGFHRAKSHAGATVRSVETNNMCYAHFPFTTSDRFFRKVENIKAHLSERVEPLNKNEAWHWRWWLKRMEEGHLAYEFDRECLSDTELHALKASGAIKSICDILADKRV